MPNKGKKLGAYRRKDAEATKARTRGREVHSEPKGSGYKRRARVYDPLSSVNASDYEYVRAYLAQSDSFQAYTRQLRAESGS